MSTQLFYWRQYQFYSIFINFHFITYIQLIRMTFQVKKVIVEQTNQQLTWKFRLINKKQTQYSFYELQQSSRSLLDLAKDINGQMDAVIQSKKKKNSPKNRTIRKACQNIIKGLKLSLNSFSHDIGEDVSTMKRFFNKDKFSDCDYDRLIEKCKKWTLSAWKTIWNIYNYQNKRNIDIV